MVSQPPTLVAQKLQKIFDERLHDLIQQINYRARWICLTGSLMRFSFLINNRIAA
jgi:hypothetical protein